MSTPADNDEKHAQEHEMDTGTPNDKKSFKNELLDGLNRAIDDLDRYIKQVDAAAMEARDQMGLVWTPADYARLYEAISQNYDDIFLRQTKPVPFRDDVSVQAHSIWHQRREELLEAMAAFSLASETLEKTGLPR